MDLNDVLYVIDGSLEVRELPEAPDGLRYEAALFDNIHDPCLLQGKGLKPEPGSSWQYATAVARGATEQAALESLAALVAGTSMSYSFPLMFTTADHWIRMPGTLQVGKPAISPPREATPQPIPEPPVAPV